MKIAIACYPTYGGSGVIATELGLALASLGHEVHFVSYQSPQRLAGEAFLPNVFFHEVEVTAYPLFRYPPYDLALASKLVEVVEMHGVEIIHAHYAVPHAVSAVLAREMAGNGVKVLTTLHGTDVTLVGQDKSYLPATRYGIRKSDAVTAVSHDLAQRTRDLCMACDIEVVYNFVDTELYKPRPCAETRAHFADPEDKVLLHVSNFRAVKRPDKVVEIFARVAAAMPARLWLVGDGPELTTAEERAAELGVGDRVHALGQRRAMEQVLPCADLFVLPSAQESFGLAALEAMSCGVPALVSRVGGLPEVVEDGVSGILGDPDEIDTMASRAVELLQDEKAHQAMAKAARLRAVEHFDRSIWIGRYEAAYRRLLS